MNITTRDFLQMLCGKCTEGCITITTLPDSRNEHISVTELDKAAERIKVLGTSANTYYCVALRQEGLPSSVRGGIGQVHTVVCMVADVDVLGSAHKEKRTAEDRRRSIDFVNSLKLKPSIIVRLAMACMPFGCWTSHLLSVTKMSVSRSGNSYVCHRRGPQERLEARQRAGHPSYAPRTGFAEFQE